MDECFEEDALAIAENEQKDKAKKKAEEGEESTRYIDKIDVDNPLKEKPDEVSDESSLTIQAPKDHKILSSEGRRTVPVSLGNFKKIYQHYCYENSLQPTINTAELRENIINHYTKKDFFGKYQTNHVKIPVFDVARVIHRKWKPDFVSKVFLGAYSSDGLTPADRALRLKHEEAIRGTRWEEEEVSIDPRFEHLGLLPIGNLMSTRHERRTQAMCLWRFFMFDCTAKSTSDEDYITWTDPGHNLSLGDPRDDLTMEVGLKEWLQSNGIYYKLEEAEKQHAKLTNPQGSEKQDFKLFDSREYREDVKAELDTRNSKLEFKEVKVWKIMGTELITSRDPEKSSKLPPCSFFFWKPLDVFIHYCLWAGIPLMIVIRLLEMQFLYAKTMAPLYDNEPLMWYHPLKSGMDSWNFNQDDGIFNLWGKEVVHFFHGFVIALGCYFVFVFVRLLRHYMEVGSVKSFTVNWTKVVSKTGGYIMRACAFAFLVYVFLVIVWSVMAAVLSPSDYLVYGVAVGTGVVVVLVAAASLQSLVSTFIDAMTGGLRKKMAEVLDAAMKEKERKNSTRVRNHKPMAHGEFTPEALFDALNVREDGILTKEDFEKFFKDLELKIDEGRIEILMAICDQNDDEVVDRKVCMQICLLVVLQSLKVSICRNSQMRGTTLKSC